MNTFLQRLAALTLLLLAAAPAAHAQGVTTSALNGTVTDNQGVSLPGVNVIAVHQPSGTRYGVATRSDGRYNLRNLRVGGPYTIQFSYIGFQSYEETGVTLALGEDRLLDVTLRDESLQAGEVEVTAERGQLLSAENKGAGTNVSQEEIERIPTINRSLTDFTRLTPQFAPEWHRAAKPERASPVRRAASTTSRSTERPSTTASDWSSRERRAARRARSRSAWTRSRSFRSPSRRTT